jgi:3-isopropylmalate dehydrogenase
MLLRFGLKLTAEADAIEAAVRGVLKDGLRTGDIAKPGEKIINTKAMADAVVERLKK